jgi:beta-phosphoglucomutase
MLAAIFDMDGLMLDTEPSYKLAWQQASLECGYEISEELYWELISRTRVDGEQILLSALGSAFPLGDFRPACRRREAEVFAESLPSGEAWTR